MNGLGNEIVVVDLRGEPPALARSTRRGAGGRRRQAARPSTSSWCCIRRGRRAPTPSCASTTPTARRPAPAATARAASRGAAVEETGKTRADLRDRRPACSTAGTAPSRLIFTVDMGPPRFGWQRDSAGRGVPRHARDRAADRADRRADPAFALGRQHGQSARHLLGRRRGRLRSRAASARCSRTIRSFPSAPISRSPRSPSPRPHRSLRIWERGAGLTKACGSAACAAAVAAARTGARRTARSTVTLPGGDLAIEWRESDDHVLMTGPVDSSTRAASIPRCSSQRPRDVDDASRSSPSAAGSTRSNPRRSRRACRDGAGSTTLVVVNTCAVTAEAVRQARQAIRRLKRERPDARIVVTGCAAQIEPQTLRRHARGRPRARQCREARVGAGGDRARRLRRRSARATARPWSTTSWRRARRRRI